jgi:hypothetical protein
MTQRNPSLLSPAEYALLLEAKEFRNRIEHYDFEGTEDRLRTICTDFLEICMLLAEMLLSVNIAEAFGWDYLRDCPDPVAQYLGSVVRGASKAGRDAAKRCGEHWASANLSEPVFRCLHCGARAVSRDRGVCMGCGAEGDEEIAALLEDFSDCARKILDLQRRTNTGPPS